MNLPLLLLVLIGNISKVAACDQCQFVDSIDESNCKVYGTIDGMLIAWNRASQECLDAYNIKISSLDPLSAGCGEVANVNSFVNAIRFGTLENSVLGGLGDNSFFVQDTNGVYSLNDSIVVSGTTYDCEASVSNCYNAMKDYFATTSGMREMQDVCGTLRAKVIVDKELEQSTLRIRLCEEIQSGAVVSACVALGDQVDAQMGVYPDKECSGFAFGSGTKAIPGCATSTTGGTPASGGPHHTKYMAALLWLLL